MFQGEAKVCIFLVLIILQIWQTYGVKTSTNLITGVPGGIAAVLTFGMARGGVMKIDYNVKYQGTNDVQNTTSVTKQAMEEGNLLMQLLVVTEDQRSQFYDGFNLVLNQTLSSNVCASPATFRKELFGNGTVTHTIGLNDPEAMQYSVLLASCRTARGTFAVNASATVSMTNAKPRSTEFSHLPIETMARTSIDVVLLVVYSVMAVGLMAQMWVSRRYFSNIHWLFLGTMLMQILDVIMDYAYYTHAESNGENDANWDFVSNFFDHSAETTVLMTFLLLSMGWHTLQFRLSQKQQMQSLGSIAAYWVLGTGQCLCTNANSSICQSIFLIKYIARALLMLACIICLNFTITQLRSMLAHSPWDPSTPYYYARAAQFQTFRVGFVLYLLLPTGFLLMQDLMFTWKEGLLNFMLLEMLNVFVLLNLGSAFAPFQDAFLTRAFDGTFSNGPQGNRPHEE